VKQSQIALLTLGAIVFVWGYNWVVMKHAVADLNPFSFLAWRFFIGAGCLFAVAAALRRPLRLTHAVSVAAIGLIHSGATFALIAWALVLGTAGKTAVLSYAMPFFVVLIAWPALGERPTRTHWTAVAIALGGFLLLLGPGGGAGMADTLALLSGLTWAIGVVLTRRHQLHHPGDTLSLSAWQNLFAGAALLALAFFVPSEPSHWSPYAVFAVLFNGIVVTALTWGLWFWVLGRLGSGIASLGTLGAPAIGVLAGMLELGERPSTAEWLGIALVIAALALVILITLRPSRS
jgi:drug/metabolite transporter (DMT)-like permease